MRTKLSTCLKKTRFRTELDALVVVLGASVSLRPYHCDRCRQFHLTSRTKGKRMPRLQDQAATGCDPIGEAQDGFNIPNLVSVPGKILNSPQDLGQLSHKIT